MPHRHQTMDHSNASAGDCPRARGCSDQQPARRRARPPEHPPHGRPAPARAGGGHA